MRIDAHQHFWKVDRGDYGWITPALPALYRDYLPEDLLPHLKEHRLGGTIVVQAATTLEETDYLLSLADLEDSILGVVGWIDVNEDDYVKHAERFLNHSKCVGFRIMIQEMADANRILEPNYVEAFKWFAKKEIPIDLLVVSHQLEPLIQLLDQVPDLHGVIDHIAKPRIADQAREPWATQMKELAKHPNLYCKLSGMVTEADHKQWKPADFTYYIQHVLELFGSQRVMFGSDWPVCLLAASYDQVMDVLLEAIPEHWSDEDKERLFGLNAKEFYRC
ncbi:amidohydrolase family protein [Paenibacillus solisilvae]|uniref:Amidohydrolase family protein n=1 Tax=Paenibacillus solisilvae TaxID=2486751 RepID=A0ABW0W464_9BACL